MRLKWPSRHKENYPFLVTCSFLWVAKIAMNFQQGKHFSWAITCEWKTEGKLGLRYHLSKEKLKEVILGHIFSPLWICYETELTKIKIKMSKTRRLSRAIN